MNLLDTAIGSLIGLENATDRQARREKEAARRRTARAAARARTAQLAEEWAAALMTVDEAEPNGWTHVDYARALLAEQRLFREMHALQQLLRDRCLPI